MMPPLKEDSFMEETICEAVGCSSKATISVVLPVGQKGSIHIYVCNECARIFQEKQSRNTINNCLEKLQHSESLVARRDQSIANLRTTCKEPHLNDNSI
jgi:hypothetical protein